MSEEGRGLTFEMLRKERILLSYQRGEARQADWDSYIDFMRSLTGISDLRFLIYHDGPAPAPRDQKRIAEVARGRSWKVALVSPSAALRFVVSAFSLVNRSIRFFTPGELDAALEHIGCTATEKEAVRAAMERIGRG